MTRAKAVPALVLVTAVAALGGSAAWAVGGHHVGFGGPHNVAVMGVSSGSGPVRDIAEARARIARVAAREGLHVGEVVQFARNYYGELLAADGSRATEVLLDPASGRVATEYGPAMMWNTRYGHLLGTTVTMRGATMMGSAGGMMGGVAGTGGAAATLGASDALARAQAWLDANRSGARAASEADAFPGYYTVHVLQDGKMTGMLSVNATTGQVWYHWWHGAFVAMSE